MLKSIIFVLYNLKIKKINHLDIKPLNILIIIKYYYKKINKYILKLSDFGESR